MVIINPITFAPIEIDETKLSAEQAELFKRVSRLTKKINRLQYEQWLCIFKIEIDTKMKYQDLLNKAKVKK